MNYKKIAQTLIKEIRGASSQNMINKSLGFSYNQYTKWENGRVNISWMQFVKLCRVLKIDLLDIMQATYPYPYKTMSSKLVISSLLGTTKTHDFASKHNISRFRLARWLNEQNEPSLHDILEIMDLSISHRLNRFLTNFTSDPERTQFSTVLQKEELEHSNPICSLAIDCLSVKEYTDQPNHIEGFLAKKLGISLDEELRLIEFMISNDMIKRENQKLVTPTRYIESSRPTNIEDQLDFFHSRSKKYFVKNTERTDLNLLALGTASINSNTLKKIRNILFKAQEDLCNAIVEGDKIDQDIDQVAHIVIQLYDPTSI